jgi:hypothetical protein
MSETQALRRPFLIGLLATVIGFVIVGGVIAIFVTNTSDRPEGIAERWLTSVSDLTRKGVHADAEKRVTAHGDLSLGESLVAGINTDGKTAFTTLEVGKARRQDDLAFVPATWVSRANPPFDHQSRVVVLRRDKDTWRVVALQPPDPSLKVPSDGGDVASKAPVALYAVGLVIGVGIAAGASALVRLAGREHDLHDQRLGVASS